MKTKIIVGISIVVAFVVGLEFGITHPKSSIYDQINQNVYRGYAGDASIYLMALNAYRRGDAKGCANILENSLESSLFALDNGYSTLAKQPDNSVYETLKEARIYRTKYQWGQDNAKMTDDVEHTMTTRVDHILSLAK
jgi:hypothetical protein